jgi:sarcosine oxidase
MRGNAAHQHLARARGATLLDNMPVTAIKPVRDEIEVVAGAQTFRCKKVILTVDAWLNGLLANFGRQLPLTITREQVTYFASPHLADFSPERFPIWIWMDEPCYYGFPAFGEAGPKAGQDVGGDEVTADTRTFDVNPRTYQRVEDFLRRFIPSALGPAIYTKTCLYTMPPDRDFIIDALPEAPNVLVGQGAAHAYKFASVIGKVLSELALDGNTASDISPFKISRPILNMANPPKNFMV